MILRNITKNKKKFYSLLIINIVVIAVLVLTALSVAGMKTEIVFLSENIEKEYLKKNKEQSVKKLVLNTQNERDTLDSYFIDKDGVVDFIEKLEDFGSASSVELELSSVNISNEGVLTIDFNTQGGWKGTAYLMSLLEKYPGVIDIRRVALMEQKIGDTNWRGSFSIVLNSFSE